MRTSAGLDALQGFLVDDARLAFPALALIPPFQSSGLVDHHIDVAIAPAPGTNVQVDVHAVRVMTAYTSTACMTVTITVPTSTARSVAEPGRRRGIGAARGGSAAVPKLAITSAQTETLRRATGRPSRFGQRQSRRGISVSGDIIDDDVVLHISRQRRLQRGRPVGVDGRPR